MLINTKQNKHLNSLDLLRGISGYGVAICHFYAFLYNNANLEYLSFLFVEFFFVLSGFVLFPQLLLVLKDKRNILRFYMRRWLRTIPLFLICLIMISLIFNEVFTGNFFKYIFFIQDIKPNFLSNAYYPIVWSLSIEEFFYVIFPIIIIFFGQKNFINKVFFLFVFLILIKFVTCNYFDTDYFRTGTLLRFDAILVGFILRYFYGKIENRFFLVALFPILLFALFYFQETFLAVSQSNYIKILFILFLQFISAVTLIIFINLESLIKSKAIIRFSNIISRQTYSVYLTHLIFIYIFTKLQTNHFIVLSIYIIMLFITSSFLYNFIEKPILKKRPKLKYP